MCDVILICPHGGSITRASKRLPMGLLAISAMLDKEGYKVEIIDMHVDKGWKKTLLSALKSNPICVGLTCATGEQILYAIEASKFVKENSDAPVIWGGVHPSTLPQQTLENQFIDIIVCGEGDITFYELVKALEKNKPIKDVGGLYYKEEGTIKCTQSRPFIDDLDSLPDLPFHLIDVRKYGSVDYTGGPSIDLITSKGCPFNCGFCYNQYFNKRRWRCYSVKKVLSYVHYVTGKYGIRDIHFVDDNIGGNPKHLKDMVKGIVDSGFDISWGTSGLRVENILGMSDAELKLLARSGCKEIGIGVESGTKRILELVNKELTLDQVTAANKRLANFPIIVKYTFMVGFPTETKKEIDQTVKYALSLAKDNPYAWTGIFVYMPYPGTELYNFAIQHGFSPPNNLEGWARFCSLDSWHNYYGSWMSKKMIDYTNSIYFLSLLYNKNIRYKITNKFTRALFDIYQPIAKFRLEHNIHAFPVEMKINNLLF